MITFFQQEFHNFSRFLGFVSGATLIVVVGPFGTFELPFIERAGYWLSWFGIVWTTTTVMFALTQRLVNDREKASWRLSLLSLLLSIPVAAFMGLILAVSFFPGVSLDWNNFKAEGTFLSPIIGCITILLHTTSKGDSLEIAVTNHEVGDAFFERLPKGIGRNLVSISVSDHYLEVKTEVGRTLILGSMNEAVSQLDGYHGCQVHRSHWIALKAIKERTWVNERLQLNLQNGATIPVSRSFRTHLLERLAQAASEH